MWLGSTLEKSNVKLQVIKSVTTFLGIKVLEANSLLLLMYFICKANSLVLHAWPVGCDGSLGSGIRTLIVQEDMPTVRMVDKDQAF